MNSSSNSSMASTPTPAPAASGWHISLQYTVFIGIGCIVGLVIIASLIKKFFDSKRDRMLLRERQGQDKERQELTERIDELQSIIETKSEIWSNGGDSVDEWDRLRAHSGIMNDALPSPILRRHHSPSIASSKRHHTSQNSISSGFRKHGASNSISSSFLEVPSMGNVGNYTLSPSDRYRLVRDPTLVHPLPAAPRNILTPMKAMTEETEEDADDDDTSLLNPPAPFFAQQDGNSNSDSSHPSALSPPSRHYSHSINDVTLSAVDQRVYNSRSLSTTIPVKSPSPRSSQKARSLRSTRNSNELSPRYKDVSIRDSMPNSTRDSMRDSMQEEIIDMNSPHQPMPIHEGYESDSSSIYSFGVNSYSSTPVHRPASIKSVRSNMSKKKRRSARPPPQIPPRRVSLREELYNPNNRV